MCGINEGLSPNNISALLTSNPSLIPHMGFPPCRYPLMSCMTINFCMILCRYKKQGFSRQKVQARGDVSSMPWSTIPWFGTSTSSHVSFRPREASAKSMVCFPNKKTDQLLEEAEFMQQHHCQRALGGEVVDDEEKPLVIFRQFHFEVVFVQHGHHLHEETRHYLTDLVVGEVDIFD